MMERTWERKARLIYEGTSYEKRAIAGGPYGQQAQSSIFDVQQWLAWFDPELLKSRNLSHKQHLL